MQRLLTSKRAHVNDVLSVSSSAEHQGITSLMCAAEAGQTRMVEALLAMDGIDINHETKANKTAIMMAACENHRWTVAAFAKADGVNRTHLICSAARVGLLEVVQKLIARDSSLLHCSDDHGTTLLHFAASGGQQKILAMLTMPSFVPGININATDVNGVSALGMLVRTCLCPWYTCVPWPCI